MGRSPLHARPQRRDNLEMGTDDDEFDKWRQQRSDNLAESEAAVEMGWLLSGEPVRLGADSEKRGEWWYTLAGQTTKHLIDGGGNYEDETYVKTFCRIEHRFRRFHLTTSPAEGDKHRCRACLAVHEVRNDVRVAVGALMHIIWWSDGE